MIKNYFKEEKAQKGEVINTKSGHQIRASVKVSLVMLNPVFFFNFLIKPSVLPVIMEKVCMPSEIFSSVLTFMTLSPSLLH